MPRDAEHGLIEDIAALAGDPYGFVMYAFPWSVAGTPLANEQGPEPWQRDLLQKVGRGLLTPDQAIRIAIASGHNVGKSCLVAWIVLWAMATCVDTRGVITANTELQLRTKTWSEIAKWHRMSIIADWFTLTATALYSSDAAHEKTWRIDAVPWSENKPEAFAGLHNTGRRILLVFDEASTIPDVIWETAEGATNDKDTEIIWCVFGNPTRNTGRFRECFSGGRFAHRWDNTQIDSRNVGRASRDQADQWVADYGEDSDFVRVRVKGEFPRAGDQQFIDGERVAEAVARPLSTDSSAPIVMGVDVARSLAGDQSVIRFRRGQDARSIPAVKMRIPDTMQIASRVAEQIDAWKPHAVFVDVTGVGAGVVDRLRQLGYGMVVGVNFGGKDFRNSDATYANKRAEMWGFLKEWLKTGCLPDDRDLTADLIGVEYGYDANNAILLEKKEDMRKRGLASPDDGDALALTFAMPVAQRDAREERRTEELMTALRRRII